MNQEELQLYEAFGYYATEELFWSLVYLNNAAFHTPTQGRQQKQTHKPQQNIRDYHFEHLSNG